MTHNAVQAYPEPSRYYPLTPFHLQSSSVEYPGLSEKSPHTVHDYLHIIHKAVNDLKGLSHSHPTFLLRQAVQSL